MKRAGFWESPIDPGVLTSSSVNYQELRSKEGALFWTEMRPSEKGRNVLMHYSVDGRVSEIAPLKNVQTKIHEYGGGSFQVFPQGIVFFDLWTESLYIKRNQEEAICLIHNPLKRFADFSISPDGSRIICVCEDHTEGGDPSNYLVSISTADGSYSTLIEGSSFYASPQFNADGTKVAFLSWDFPFMSWEECSLTISAFIDEDLVGDLTTLGRVGESISQFIWLDQERIVFASDRTGFWNLYLFNGRESFPLYGKEADFSSPLWVLGRKSFTPIAYQGKEALLCVFTKNAVDCLAILFLDGALEILSQPYNVIKTLDASSGVAYFVGGSEQEPLAIIQLNLETRSIKKISESFHFPEELTSLISSPEEISTEGCFGFYYPPKNPFYEVLEPAPLVVRCHGGPTMHVTPLLNPDVQFWTSRGFGFLEVNYRGSSGFGRMYRSALNGRWGVLDVQDVLALSLRLVELNKADPKALFVKGSSSGGLTALNLAATGHFKACTSFYGVTDLTLLAEETHKFEKFYLDSLVEKDENIYQERSPVFYPEKIECPVLFLHGGKDFIVPVSQASRLCDQLQKGEMVVFPEEGHGFKLSATTKKCLELELSFYQKNLLV